MDNVWKIKYFVILYIEMSGGVSKRVYSAKRNVDIGGGVDKAGLPGSIGIPTMLRRFVARRAPDAGKSAVDEVDQVTEWIYLAIDDKLYKFDGSAWTLVNNNNTFIQCFSLVSDDQLYMFDNASAGNNKIKIYNGSETSTSISIDNISNLNSFSCVLYNNNIYIIGGSGGSNVFKLEGNTAIAMTSMPEAKQYLSSAVYNGYIYAVGGAAGGSFANNRVFKYKDDAWTNAPSMVSARLAPGVVVYRGLLYAIGGLNAGGTMMDTVETLTDSGTSWLPAPPLNTARVFHSCVVYNDLIYVFGGFGADNNLILTTEVFNGAKWETINVAAPYDINTTEFMGYFNAAAVYNK